jgi:hypothetical protein
MQGFAEIPKEVPEELQQYISKKMQVDCKPPYQWDSCGLLSKHQTKCSKDLEKGRRIPLNQTKSNQIITNTLPLRFEQKNPSKHILCAKIEARELL